MGINAFTKTGNTVVFTANVAAPTPVQAASVTLGGNQYRVINPGNVVVFLGYGQTSSDATNNAAVVSTTGPVDVCANAGRLLASMKPPPSERDRSRNSRRVR